MCIYNFNQFSFYVYTVLNLFQFKYLIEALIILFTDFITIAITAKKRAILVINNTIFFITSV